MTCPCGGLILVGILTLVGICTCNDAPLDVVAL
jgi:hypothetical protein